MTKSGCIIERTPKQIANKINELVRSYRDAIAFKNSTGQQHLSDEDMENAVFGICKYFNELDPILRDRPSTEPLLTNKVSESLSTKKTSSIAGNDMTIVASSPESAKASLELQSRTASSKKKDRQ